MEMRWEIVTTSERFQEITKTWTGPVACDVETAKDVHLLGISLSNGSMSIYVPVTVHSTNNFSSSISTTLKSTLMTWLSANKLIGHNFTYDKRFIDSYFDISSKWVFDTRIGWHLASAPSGPRPYGLKDAQIEVLGWEAKGDMALKAEVEAAGGKLSNGDHYLASLNTLAKYACLDTLATYQLYARLNRFFVDNDYHWMMEKMMQYNLLLEENTTLGVAVNRPGLERAHEQLSKKALAAKKRFIKLIGPEVAELEEDWKDRRISEYKREYNKVFYEAHPEKWTRFNFNSDSHKRELFFDKLRLPVLERTPSKLPSTSADSLRQSVNQYLGTGEVKEGANDTTIRVAEAVGAYLIYEKSNTLTTNFSKPYLDSIQTDGRLHPGFNICGTVSYRLSGFKPYLLNAPFDEKLILQNLTCDPGYIGVHADLAAIEPTITAHYSDDPSLHKVFGKGLGDIYLDLALELFPTDYDLRAGYNPNAPITKKVKEQFAKQRKIAKVIQLAVQYTGTGHTVSKNLTKDGVPTTVRQAEKYVEAYWRKFAKVKEMNSKLFALNYKEGHLRNVIGRIIQVPFPDYKDLPNRFLQSSAHDVLILWVSEIYRLAKEAGIGIRPILLDCHDSTSNQIPRGQENETKLIYAQALANVNDALGLSVTIKAEVKTFETLAGLKGDE